MDSMYEYESLDDGRQQIRVVTLKPSAWRDEIHCCLGTISLDEATSTYEALSYVWGDPAIRRDIFLDGFLVSVTENLWLALRRLRDPLHSRVIWIYAICINQQDDQERSRQVAMMGKIYENCNEVILWLGEDDAVPRQTASTSELPPISIEAQRAFELMRLFALDEHLPQLPCFLAEDDAELRPSEEFKPHFEAARKLFNRPWWRRIWIVQEMVLPDIGTIVYASESCPYEIFETSATLFAKHCETCCGAFYARYRGTDPLTNHVVQSLTGVVHGLNSIRWYYRNNRAFSLTELRMILCASFATDQRDLFYGLLGLVMASNTALDSWVPDYSLSPRAAIAIAVVKEIERSKSLSILTGLRWPGSKSSQSMPTWLAFSSIGTLPPDWSGFTERRLRRSLSFNASRHHHPDVRLLDDSCLLAKGIRVGRVQLVGVMYEKMTKIQVTIRQWAQMVGVDNALSWPEQPPPPGSLADAFWKTVLCSRLELGEAEGRNPKFRQPTDDDYPSMREWLIAATEPATTSDVGSKVAVGPTPFPPFWSYFSAEQSLGFRKMILTQEGYIGLAPQEVRPGDELYIFIGSNVPFYLRPCNARVSGHLGDGAWPSFTVLGDGYLHGFMEGEALDGVDVGSLGFVKLD